MEITKEALKNIEQLRIKQHRPKRTGLRLGLHRGQAFIKWETHKPRDSDRVLMKRAIPVIIDETAYARLQKYTLDFIVGRSAQPHFCLRHGSRDQEPHV